MSTLSYAKGDIGNSVHPPVSHSGIVNVKTAKRIVAILLPPTAPSFYAVFQKVSPQILLCIAGESRLISIKFGTHVSK